MSRDRTAGSFVCLRVVAWKPGHTVGAAMRSLAEDGAGGIEPATTDCLEAKTTITGAYCSQVLVRWRQGVKEKRRGKLNRNILLLHDKASEYAHLVLLPYTCLLGNISAQINTGTRKTRLRAIHWHVASWKLPTTSPFPQTLPPRLVPISSFERAPTSISRW